MADSVDAKVELKFLEEKIVKIQKEILEMENEALPEAERMVLALREGLIRRRKQLEDFKVRKIRIVAELEEAKV